PAHGNGGREDGVLEGAQPEHAAERPSAAHAGLPERDVVDREPSRQVRGEHRPEPDTDHGERGRQGNRHATVDLGGCTQVERVPDVGDQLSGRAQAEPAEVVDRDRVEDVAPAGLPDEPAGGGGLEGEDDRESDDRVGGAVEPPLGKGCAPGHRLLLPGRGRALPGHRDQLRSAVWKNEAIAPAEPATTTTAQSSSRTSTTLPAAVSGFLSCDETVSSCTVVKKSASPKERSSVPGA